MSEEELKTELERLRNENAALKKGASLGIRLKVSEKGAVSVHGPGRFPVTFTRLSGGKQVRCRAMGISSAMKSADFIWDEANLNRFIANPDEMVPGK